MTVLDFMKLSYIFTLITLAIMNFTLYICATKGIDSKPRNETTATTANASLGSSTISVGPFSTTLPSVDADKGHVKSNLSERNTQQLLSHINTNCGCNYSKQYYCTPSEKPFNFTDPYVKGNESQFYDNIFPLFYMTENEKKSATNIFNPYNDKNIFEFYGNLAFNLSWLFTVMHNLCADTDSSIIMSVCESELWLKPVSDIYNCRKRLDMLSILYFRNGFDLLKNNIDGSTIHKLIERIIIKIDLNISNCLDKIMSQDQKATVASAYAKNVDHASIYSIIATDKRKYHSDLFSRHTRRKRSIKFTDNNSQVAKTSKQGTSGHKINKQLDSDVKTRINRV